MWNRIFSRGKCHQKFASVRSELCYCTFFPIIELDQRKKGKKKRDTKVPIESNRKPQQVGGGLLVGEAPEDSTR